MAGKKLAIPAISLKQWVRNVFHFANVGCLSWADTVEKLGKNGGLFSCRKPMHYELLTVAIL